LPDKLRKTQREILPSNRASNKKNESRRGAFPGEIGDVWCALKRGNKFKYVEVERGLKDLRGEKVQDHFDRESVKKIGGGAKNGHA